MKCNDIVKVNCTRYKLCWIEISELNDKLTENVALTSVCVEGFWGSVVLDHWCLLRLTACFSS